MNSNTLFTGFACLLLVQFIATLLLFFSGISFPPALLGMIILTLLLLGKVIKISQVEDACTLLLEKMGMFFVPAGVSIILYADIIFAESFAIFATIIVTSIIITAVTGMTVEFLLKRGEKHNA